jgi:hypothetical protein
MKFLFHNDAPFNKLILYVSDTWKCLRRGEGEEEIANHGRSRVEVFSQETEAIGQQGHGVTKLSRSYTLKSQVQDARDSRTLTPLFSSFKISLFGAHREDGSRESFSSRGFSLRTVLALFFLSLLAVIFDSMAFVVLCVPALLRNSFKASAGEAFSRSSVQYSAYRNFWS